MRSMFETGFNRNFFWMGNGGRGGGHPSGWREEERLWPERYCDPSMEPCPTPFVGPGAFAMGQTTAGSIPTGTLTPDQKDAVYALLKDAVTKGLEVDAWIHSAGEGGQRTAMGASFDEFRSYINHASDLADTAYPYYQRLGSDNGEDWYVLDTDVNTLVDFVNTVNAAYQLYSAKVKNVPAPAPVPVRPNPAAPRPVPPTPGAKAAPGTKAAAKPILPPAAPAVSPLAIGVGVAAVATLIFVALR